MVLRDRGIPVAEMDRPASIAPVNAVSVGASAWRLLGIGRASIEGLGVVTTADIINRALRLVNVNASDIVFGYSTGQTFPLTDIGDAALRKLEVVASDETPSTDDHNEAARVAFSVHEALVADGIAYWPPSAVPYAAFENLVIMTANQLAPYFGRPSSPENYQAAMEMIVKHALNGQTAIDRAQATLTAVHGDLTGRGFIDWPLNAIPAGTLESYVTMVANRMGPVYGKARDDDQYATAEMQVRRFALSASFGDGIAAQKVGEVHDALNALGLVSWPTSAIPTAYANDYAVMASTLLAPFAGLQRDAQGRQVDAAMWDAAAAHVKRGAMIAGMQERALIKVQAVHNEMLAMGLVSWTLDAIPASMADAYAEAATALMGAESGELDPKAQQAAYSRIRMVAMNGPAGQALAEEKVRETHFEWAGRGKVQWTLFNIPRYAERLYVDKAASLLAPEMAASNALAPEVNVAEFMQLAVAAERSLAQITMVPSNGRPVAGVYF
jgi:hypothetical protein